jgi:hypothetical protein
VDTQKAQFKPTEFKYRGHFNPELAGRYSWTSELEKTVKDDAATAHRTSTQLRKTCERFEAALSDEQKLALKAAASSMARLARELDELKPWAKSKVSHEKAEHAAREKFEEEAFALERWSGDEPAMMAEFDHAKAFVSEEGRTWLIKKHKTDRALVLSQGADQLERLKAESTASDVRLGLIKFLQDLRRSSGGADSRLDGRGIVITTRWAGWNDYCLFLAARAGAAASAGAVLDRLASVEGGAL